MTEAGASTGRGPRGPVGRSSAPDDGHAVGPPSITALAEAFGLDAAGAAEVRAATRHVVRFPVAAVRTFAVRGHPTAARQEAAVAALLADAGVPATRRVAGPIAVDGWTVTAWREIPGVDADAEPVGPEVVGGLARRLHTATGGLDRRGLVVCDPVGAALAQLEVAVSVGRTSDAELTLLRRAATRLEGVWGAAVDEAEAAAGDGEGSSVDLADVRAGAVVHGDLHGANVVVGRDGPVLVDLELAGWGPRAYDAAPTVAGDRLYARSVPAAPAFDEAYGEPLGTAAAARGLDEVWTLWSTCWSVANRHRGVDAEEEARVRIETMATGDAPRPWTLR